jgi:LysR family transcriptional regulator, glycine cleavage system transcriptional activator
MGASVSHTDLKSNNINRLGVEGNMPRLSAFPTISELRAFEAAARLRSISGAALELRCSQPCVTHRIKSLEQRWATELLNRSTRVVEWTPVTTKVYDRVLGLLNDLEKLVGEFDLAPEAQHVAISVSSAFASSWLIPRLSSFRARNPSIEVRLSATNRYVDLVKESFDVAIRLMPTDCTLPPGHASVALTVSVVE